jgi:hypothetical protein
LRRFGRRWLAPAIIVVITASAAHAAWAAFAGTATVSQSASSAGDLKLTIPASGASNRMSIDVSDLYPGVSRYRVIDLTIAGSLDYADLYMMDHCSSQSCGSLITNTGNKGIQLTVDRCSVAWTEAGSSPDYTYSCGGTQANVLASDNLLAFLTDPAEKDFITANMLLTAGSVNHLRFTFTLPTTALAAMQSQTGTMQFTFEGDVRAATTR